MKVFISWSGERSKLLAGALRDWIRPILQSVEVWMSEADIDAGDRWGQEVARELSACNFGIICVTPENAKAPWLLFESGALAKSLEGSKVIPLLFELELRDISGPLAQFQAKKFDRIGLAEVANSINKAIPNPIEDPVLKSLLDAMWPMLQQKIEAVPKREALARNTRSQADILEELVAGVRSFDSRLREAEFFASEQGLRQRRKRPRHFIPMMFEMLADTEGNDPIGLVVIAGLLREDAPWFSDVLIESYREIRRGSQRQVERVVERIHRLSRMTLSGPFSEELGPQNSKEFQILMMELPMILDQYLSRFKFPRLPPLQRNIERKSDEDSSEKN